MVTTVNPTPVLASRRPWFSWEAQVAEDSEQILGVRRHAGIGGSLSLTRQGLWGHQANPNTRSPSRMTAVILKTHPPSQWVAWRHRAAHLRRKPLGAPDRCALPPRPPAANEDPSFSAAQTRIDEDLGEHSDRQGKAVNLSQACNLS